MLSVIALYVRLLVRLDDLMQQGKGDDPEADAIRDQMDEPWYAMTEKEREFAREMADLLNQPKTS